MNDDVLCLYPVIFFGVLYLLFAATGKRKYLSLFVFNETNEREIWAKNGENGEERNCTLSTGRERFMSINKKVPSCPPSTFRVFPTFATKASRKKGGCMKDLWIFERKSRLTNRYFVCRERRDSEHYYLYQLFLRHHLASSSKRAPGRKRAVARHIVRRQKSSLTASHILNWRVKWLGKSIFQ